MAQAKKKAASTVKTKRTSSKIEPLPIGDQRKLSVQILVWLFALLSVTFAVLAYNKYV